MDDESKEGFDGCLFEIRKLRGSGVLPEIAAYLHDYKEEMVKAGFTESQAMELTVAHANMTCGGG